MQKLSDDLQRYIAQFVSAYDAANKESFYHGLLLGLTALVLNDYTVESNRESGYGRFDLAIFPKEVDKAGVIMEFKVAADENEMEEKAKEACSRSKTGNTSQNSRNAASRKCGNTASPSAERKLPFIVHRSSFVDGLAGASLGLRCGCAATDS